MQEHFYALYVFTVRSNGGVATTPPLLVDFEDLPYPVFASKMTAEDARTAIKDHFA